MVLYSGVFLLVWFLNTDTTDIFVLITVFLIPGFTFASCDCGPVLEQGLCARVVQLLKRGT